MSPAADAAAVADAPEPGPQPAYVPAGPSDTSTRRFRLRPGPLFLAICLIIGFRFLPSLLIDMLSDYVWLPVHGSQLVFYFADHTVMLLLALGAIRLFQKSLPADYCMHMPRGRSYVATAIVLSVLFGLVMAFVDYMPFIISRIPPPLDDYFSRTNFIGWMLYQGVYVGPTEEIPFRALLVTYLTETMPGKVRIWRLRMDGGGATVAALFAIGTALPALIAEPFFVAILQIAYVFFFGVALAYWLEKSKSILAPIIGHNLAFGIKQGLLFAIVGWLR